jgi:parallel beta-helix repeat protein
VLVSFLIIGGFVGFIYYESENARGTLVSGFITIDTTWNVFGNPYIVVDDVTVTNGATLTIESGVVIRFDGYYSIYVDSNIMAVGNNTDRILITTNNMPPTPADWKDIQINSKGHAEIMYCDISYSYNGIHLSGASHNNISNNKLMFNSGGITLFQSSNNTITNNTLLENDKGISSEESSSNILSNNTFSYNEVGIYLLDSSNFTLTNNDFVNDGIYLQGNILQHFNSHTIPTDNMVNSKPLYYFRDGGGFSFDNMHMGQLIIANCTEIDIRNLESVNITVVAIQMAYSNNILITNNNISSTKLGIITLFSCSNNTIINNHIMDSYWGIEIKRSWNNSVIANNVTSHSYIGIGVGESSCNNLVANNEVHDNSIGVHLGTDWMDNSSNNSVVGNNISNCGIGIYNHWTSYNFINSNIIYNCGHGIYLYSINGIVLPHDNIITGNTISTNGYGCFLDKSPNNNIAGNHILNNDYGIYLTSSLSSSNNITNNNISNNGYGVYNDWTYDNLIYHNYFVNNTNQAFDPTNNANQWDNGYPSGGNYWSDFDEPGEGAYDDYEGPDQDILGSDGIVDNGTIGGGGINPYVIDSDSMDYYPLIQAHWFLFLYEDWNLISIPRIQIDTNPGTILSSISGAYNTIQWYNSTDTKDHWKHNCTSKPQSLNDFDNIDHLIGFWIFITEPGGVLLEYSGPQPGAPENIPLHTGWNMVGYPSLSNKNRTAALNNLTFGVEVDSVWTFDGATQTWEEVGPGDEFKLGRGYWVHAAQECVWEVPV